jgi:hypothetical protein
MNNSAYVVSGIIAFVFLVAKFVEMRFSANKSEQDDDTVAQPKPLKVLVRDAVLVYMSSLLGFFLVAQFEEHAAVGSSAAKEVAAFTGGPDF